MRKYHITEEGFTKAQFDNLTDADRIDLDIVGLTREQANKKVTAKVNTANAAPEKKVPAKKKAAAAKPAGKKGK